MADTTTSKVVELKHFRKEEERNAAATTNGGKAKGLAVWQIVLFIVGEVVGGGILALPYAILNTGWIGILLLLWLGFIAGYTGIVLGKCWIIVEERQSKYAGYVRNPYQMIAYEAYGPRTEQITNVLMVVATFGSGVVMVLLISGMLTELMSCFWKTSICIWVIIMVAILTPISWLGTPKDFWGLALGASLSVLIAAILLLAQIILDSGRYDNIHYPEVHINELSLSFGTIQYAFSGSAIFPTIQNDMKDRKKFKLAVLIGVSVIMVIYIPIAVTGYLVFGNHLQANLALTVSDGPLRKVAQALLLIHLLCSFMLTLNPTFQSVEEHFKVKREFGWQRCLLRTSVMLASLFTATSVPSFSKILNLIGGSAVTLLGFTFPALFYMKLTSQKNPACRERNVPLHETAFLWEIIFISIFGEIASTLSAIWEIATPDALSLPCYVS